MKIAVVSDDERTISSHFGRSKGFIVLEVEGQELNTGSIAPILSHIIEKAKSTG